MALDGNIIRINREILEDIKIELAAQGHELTGKLFDRMYSQVSIEGTTLVLEGFGPFVVEILNDGVPIEKIPYDPDKVTGAGTSKYIAGLQRYAQKRFGLSKKEALGAAFAIAHKHKKEGMPTKESYKYSSTGERLGAVGTVFKENASRYEQKIGTGIDIIMNKVFNEQKSETV